MHRHSVGEVDGKGMLWRGIPFLVQKFSKKLEKSS